MHDLMHDLATLLGREFYFRSEEIGKESEVGVKTRHLSFGMFNDPLSENIDVFGRVKFVRTFLPINLKESPFHNEKAACMILLNLKYVRVLSFCEFSGLDALPDSIGELIHLRYLDLSWTSIPTLPESMCKLYKLQTLKLRFCYKLKVLPSGMQNLIHLRHLDLTETALEEMPGGMGKLNDLQHLSTFVVGKQEEKGLKELGKLSNLEGSLCISNIETVGNSIEAMEGRKIDKKVGKLCFEWCSEDDFTDLRSEMDILKELQPHRKLQKLEIIGYRGTRFTDWVGYSSYQNMTELWLIRCKNCCMLPSLGQLPSLERLSMWELNGLQSIGVEFFKNDDSFSGTCFPSLKYLRFRDMPCWEVWHSFESYAFPQLEKLDIVKCPRLKGQLPAHLPALRSLLISTCEELACSLPCAPSIRELIISGSSKLELQEVPSSVEILSIEGRQVESMFEAITNTNAQPISFNFYSSMGDCLPASLTILHVRNCQKLEFSNKNPDQLPDLLASLPQDTFSNLNCLQIFNCHNIGCVTVSQSLQNLAKCTISGCPIFVSFPTEGLPAPNLIQLAVENCEKLKSLPGHMNTLLPKLEYLSISDCPKIESFPEGGMPPSLRTLRIYNCHKLLRSPSLASMDMLSELRIYGPCEEVNFFPMDMLPPSLTYLYLRSLQSLETLECKDLLHHSSLQQLTIEECPKLENIVGERLPASLIKLEINGCPLLQQRCHMKHLQIWPKISHIRGIKIEGRWIP